MYELKTNTAVRIAVGPLVDPTDGKTAETALTVTGMTCNILQMDNDNTAVNRTSFSPTASGGNNDMVHVTDDTVGMYDLELTAAQLNFLGNARLVFYDVDGFLVHWIDLQVVSAAYFDWKYGTTIPNVNVTQISGDTTAADNCELMFDGTGYAGGTTKLDVNVSTIANNAITAASINADAITNAKIADNAIAAENLAADCITSAKIADNAFANEHFADGALTSTEITSAGGCVVASIANNAITANAINNDAITAAKIANGAIDAATFAADVDAEIATMVWNAATASYGGAGTYGQAVEDVRDDTNELQTDWHDGGRLDSLLDGASAPSAATVADAVWDEALAGHAGVGSAGAALTAAGSAGDPWATALPGAYGAGTAGLLLGTTIPNAITTIDNEIAVIDGIVDDILVDTGTTLDTLVKDIPTNAELASAFTEIKGATWSAATDTLEHIRDKETDIETDTQDLQTQVGVDGAGLTALPWNAAWDAEVQSECTDALNAYDPPTNAEMELRTLPAADYTVVSDLGTVQTGDCFAIVNGDHGLVSIQDDVDAIKAKTDSLTFTQAGQVDANVQSVNDVALTGDGSATPWGPA